MIKLTTELPHQQEKWRNDPRVHAWTRQNGILPAGSMESWKKRLETDPTVKMFGIQVFDGSTAGFCGTCGLTSIDLIHRKAEFSCLIGPEFQGRGYGRLALIELFNYGFRDLGLNKIWGETLVGNHALNIFLKLGMKEEGLLKQTYFKNGKFVDSIMIGLVKSEWENQPWARLS